LGHAKRRPKRLAEKLLQIREALGLSQRKIAERIRERAGVEISYKNISKYELGKSTPPMEIALAYARLAGIPLEHIVDDEMELDL
jgi:transcriptional regulator with XRE-family HTH domain